MCNAKQKLKNDKLEVAFEAKKRTVKRGGIRKLISMIGGVFLFFGILLFVFMTGNNHFDFTADRADAICRFRTTEAA